MLSQVFLVFGSSDEALPLVFENNIIFCALIVSKYQRY